MNMELLFYFLPDCYSPALIPLKPFSRSDDIEASLEAQTFCQQNIETLVPFTDYVNNFYVYPISLNFNSQKMFKVKTLHSFFVGQNFNLY